MRVFYISIKTLLPIDNILKHQNILSNQNFIFYRIHDILRHKIIYIYVDAELKYLVWWNFCGFSPDFEWKIFEPFISLFQFVANNLFFIYKTNKIWWKLIIFFIFILYESIERIRYHIFIVCFYNILILIKYVFFQSHNNSNSRFRNRQQLYYVCGKV